MTSSIITNIGLVGMNLGFAYGQHLLWQSGTGPEGLHWFMRFLHLGFAILHWVLAFQWWRWERQDAVYDELFRPKNITAEDVRFVVGRPVDFSVFHPLDHWAGSPYCFGWHGGPVRHIELWWDYMRPEPIGALKCRLGRHEVVPYWQSKGGERIRLGDDEEPSGYQCRRCWIELDKPA